MRRFRDRQPTGLFRGGELARLMTMIVMLGVLAMMFRRASDVDTWRFLTGEPAKLEQGPSPAHGALKPRARSRPSSQSSDSVVVSAPDSDVELTLTTDRKVLPPAPLALVAPGGQAPSGQTPSAEQPPADAAIETVIALAPQPIAAESPVSPPAGESGPPAVARPATEAPAQAQNVSDQSAAKEDSPAADAATSDALPAGTPPADAPRSRLYRPHLPAGPEKFLDPNAIPEKPVIEAGPIDEEPQERQAFDHECEAISDRTPISKEEMFAYWRLLRWAQSQTTDDMLKRARGGVRYGELLEHPEDFRGELIKVKLHIVRVLEEEAPPDIPVKLHHYYQAVGWNDASQAWFYHCVFEDLPEGMQLGERVYEEGTFVGYFFKTFVYLDGKGAKIKSPVLVGRMIYHPTPSIAHNPNEWIWSWAIGGVLLVLFVARWGWRFYRPRKAVGGQGVFQRPSINEAGEPVVPIEDWLEQAESQVPESEIKTAENRDTNG